MAADERFYDDVLKCDDISFGRKRQKSDIYREKNYQHALGEERLYATKELLLICDQMEYLK